jgi:hypothetical protein
LNWGDRESFLLSLEERGETVNALLNKPELESDQIPYWEAFAILSNSRPVGFAVGHIPLTEIEAYMRITCVDDDDERADLLYFIREMDAEYMSYVEKKSKK